MARVRGRDTGPELLVRRLLHRLGYRYRVVYRGLPGTPDLAFTRRRAAVFVHGCFWHGHDCPRGRRTPKANADYWRAKIARNRARDAETAAALAAAGWRSLTLWECELGDAGRMEATLRAFLGAPLMSSDIAAGPDPRGGASAADGQGSPTMTTMQAAVLAGPGRIELARAPRPEPGPGEVRVRLEGCGVCASNVEPYEGQPWSRFPGEPGGLGHEGWGVVDAVGEGVTGVAVGDRVATLAGRSFAEYDIAAADAVVALPPALAGRPFPGEPLGCAMNIFRRSDIQAGQTVAIVGVGFLGAVLTRLATDAGAQVIAISRRQSSLDLGRRFGAAETVVMDDHHRIIADVRRIAGDGLCERVIEAVGKQWPLDLAGELVGFGGKLIVAGYHQDGPRQVNMQMWNWKGIDVVNAHERDPAVALRGLREAVEAVASGRLDPAPLYTHRYALAEVGAAIEATRDKPDGFVKALVLHA